MLRSRCFALVSLILLCSVPQLSAATSPPPPSAPPPEQLLRQTIGALASDEFEGRRVGEHGGQLAFEYLRGELDILAPTQSGPLPQVQPFDVTRGIKVVGEPSLRLGESTLTFGNDFDIAPFSGSGSTENAPLVFAGYGIVAPDLGWNDYADLDVKGAVVIIVRGEPQAKNPDSKFSGDQPSTYADLRRKASTARDLGAA